MDNFRSLTEDTNSRLPLEEGLNLDKRFKQMMTNKDIKALFKEIGKIDGIESVGKAENAGGGERDVSANQDYELENGVDEGKKIHKKIEKALKSFESKINKGKKYKVDDFYDVEILDIKDDVGEDDFNGYGVVITFFTKE